VLGGVVVELQQHVEVVGDLRVRPGPLGAVLGHEGAGSGLGVLAVFGVPDLGQRGLRAGLCGLGERVEDVGDLVEPAALLAGGREDVTQRGPEPERSVADGEHWRSHAAALAVPEQVGPRLRRLAVPIGERRGL
jgi:hypothetical protein